MNEIENRRSIRKYQSTEINPEILTQIINAGILAPSAKNRQPWKFIILTPESKKEFIKVMNQGIQDEETEEGVLPNSKRHIMAAKYTVDIIEQAPVLMLVVNPDGRSLYENLTVEEKIYERADIQSVGAAIQNMLLKATSLGIGSLWICDIYFAYDNLTTWLKGGGEILAAITLGYPAEYPSQRPRKSLDKVIEYH